MTDLAFEALAEVCGIDWRKDPDTGIAPITKDQRGRLVAALKQLRAIYPDDLALPMMVHERAAAWREVYPEIPCTPQSLTGNWSSILEAAAYKREQEKVKTKDKRRQTNAPATNRDCICGGDKMIVTSTDLKTGTELATPCWQCNGGVMPTGWAA